MVSLNSENIITFYDKEFISNHESSFYMEKNITNSDFIILDENDKILYKMKYHYLKNCVELYDSNNSKILHVKPNAYLSSTEYDIKFIKYNKQKRIIFKYNLKDIPTPSFKAEFINEETGEEDFLEIYCESRSPSCFYIYHLNKKDNEQPICKILYQSTKSKIEIARNVDYTLIFMIVDYIRRTNRFI